MLPIRTKQRKILCQPGKIGTVRGNATRVETNLMFIFNLFILNRSLFHIILRGCLVFQEGKRWNLYQAFCNRLQSLVNMQLRTKLIPANRVLSMWINCGHCLLAIRYPSSGNDGLLRFVYPQSSLSRLSSSEPNQ